MNIYIYNFVKELAKTDDRFVIIQPSTPIKPMLEKYGYPFKSKQHSHNLDIYYHSKNLTTTTIKYLGIEESKTKFRCPKILHYQFTPEFNLHCSDKCCYKLKKEPAKKWEKESNKSITLTGMRKAEKGQRTTISCIVTDKDKNLVKFHPLAVVSDEFENYLINKYNIKLCDLYYEPYNFQRTGCAGCPFIIDLQKQLDIMEKLLPNERKRCEMIWKPVYDEYRWLGYRLEKEK